jgi:hypothetical protein
MAPPDPTSDEEAIENVAHNPLPSNKKVKAKKNPKPSQVKTIDFNNDDLTTDPALEYNTAKYSHRKDNESADYNTNNSAMKINTMTDFSRLDVDEEKDDMDMYDQPMEQPDYDDRVACKNCGRKFNPDRLPVHQKSCNNYKKRSVFNSQNKRAQGGGIGNYVTPKKQQVVSKKAAKQQAAKSEKSAKWKREHNELMKAIKMSRLIKKVEQEGGDVSKIPMPPSEVNEDYVECQYCYRRYAPNVADRHIPKCKNMINRPKPPPHILKRIEKVKAEKRAKQNNMRSRRNEDMKRMTANAFGAKLQTTENDEGMKTQYPFKPPLKKIREENEEGPYKNSNRSENNFKTEKKMKRGQSVNSNPVMQSNGFAKSMMGNNTSYQSNFQDTAISTSTSKNFVTSPMQNSERPSKYKRSESLLARSACYSQVSCPHCDRTFASGAAERHVPICSKIIKKPNTLRDSNRKRSSVQLPHLSKTNYSSGTFRTTETKMQTDLSKTQTPGGLPPTYKNNKSNPGSRGMEKTRKDFAMKR